MSESFTPLDLLRMFFGEGESASPLFLVEIVLRTSVMYAYTIVLTRLVGQGTIGQIGPFEFVLVIAVGSAAGDPMFYPDVPLVHGLLVISVVILLHRGTQWVLTRSVVAEGFVEGTPLLVVRGGHVMEDALGSGRLTRRELLSLLRVQGVRNIGTIECAYFEPSGKLSVFQYPKGKEREGEYIIPIPENAAAGGALG